jgi:hypothetical protein
MLRAGLEREKDLTYILVDMYTSSCSRPKSNQFEKYSPQGREKCNLAGKGGGEFACERVSARPAQHHPCEVRQAFMYPEKKKKQEDDKKCLLWILPPLSL